MEIKNLHFELVPMEIKNLHFELVPMEIKNLHNIWNVSV
jgi:hypothetical protein